MTLLDISLMIVYLFLCLLIGSQIKNKHSRNPLYRKWFMPGLRIKLFFCIAYCLVYTYYYDYGGDTKGYYRDTLKVLDALQYGITPFYEVINRVYSNISPEALNILLRMTYDAPMEYYAVHISAIFVFLGFGSYFSASLLIALFSYWGVWHFFLLLVEKFPNIEKQMAFAILFIPSVVFWGSGLNKDTYILCFIGLFLYNINKVLNGRVFDFKGIAIIFITGYLIFIIKAYVLISLIPAVLVWRTLFLRDKIKIGWIRSLVLPIFGSLAIVTVVYALNILGQYNKKYSVNSFVKTAQSMQGWHYVEGHNTSEQFGRGSSYSLGEYEETTIGLLKIFPAAVNVTYFRPYLWEVKNAAMLAQALESLAFLLFTLYVIFKVGPYKFYKIISNDSFVLMCLVFAIFFGFAVGFSSYNFGALSRYKIPAVPFYVAALFIIRYKYLEAKKAKFQKILARQEQRGGMAVPGFSS